MLRSGAYRTSIFTPALAYIVPAGWQNLEDTPGNVLLVPPGNSLAGVNAATSDLIGVYTKVRPSANCDAARPRSVANTPAGFVGWLHSNPGFRVSHSSSTKIGGLRGFVVDLRMSAGWTKKCPYSQGAPLVPLMSCDDPSSFDHNLIPGQLTRLYLLENGDGVLGIEIVDIHDAGRADAYSAVVRQFTFSS